MFISIKELNLEKADDNSHILITVLDEIGRPEQTRKFDNKIKDYSDKWIQARHLNVAK